MAPRGRKPRSVVPACTGTVSIQERASEVGQDPKARNCWAARDAGSGGRPQRRQAAETKKTGQLIKLMSVITTATAAQFLSWFAIFFWGGRFGIGLGNRFFFFWEMIQFEMDHRCGMAWILVSSGIRCLAALSGRVGWSTGWLAGHILWGYQLHISNHKHEYGGILWGISFYGGINFTKHSRRYA